MNSCNPSPSVSIPLLAMVPAEAEEQQPSSFYSQLSTTTSHFGFGLPDGWLVEEKRRPLTNTCNPGKMDKFYIEPEKGLKFRSLGAVHEYLAEGQIDRYTTKLKPGSQCIKQYNPRSSSTSSFILPDDWIIEERPRKNPAHIDRYYIEPGTGLKFRSRAAVQRYLTEGKIDIRTRKPNPGGEYINQFAPRRKCSSSFILPDDWVIEEKPRPKNPSHIDKYYIEPGTGQRFRSLASVESYLSGANDCIPLKALMPANVSSLSPGSSHKKIKSLTEIQSQQVVPNSLKRNDYAANSRPPRPPAPKPPASSSEIQSQQIVPSSLKRNICGANDRLPMPQAPKPPAKVHWVLDGPAGEDKWFPFIGNSQVPESVMGNWAETFISTMYRRNIGAPSFKS